MAFIEVTLKDGRKLTVDQANILSVGEGVKRDTSFFCYAPNGRSAGLNGQQYYTENIDVTDAEGVRISNLLTASQSDSASA